MFETAPELAVDPASVPPPSPDSSTPASPSPRLTEILGNEIAPANLVSHPRGWERLAWYAGSLVLTGALLFGGLRLDRADLKAPFYYDLDSLLILPLVKATVERGPGGHWRNERLGAGVDTPERPQFQELYDFPVIDYLHFTLIWLLSKAFSSVVVVYNLYYLLTFPLTTLTAMIVFRHLGLTLPAAAVGGLLYSFLPYHHERWENHYFLSAYWMVPLAFLPIFAICRGSLPFFRRTVDGTYQPRLWSWSSLGYLVLGIGVATAGAYYAFFTCALLVFAGLYGAVMMRNWRAIWSAGGVVAVIVITGILCHLPTILYQWQNDSNPITDRHPEEADNYGLKLAHLILPIPDHNLRVLANLRVRYLAPNRPSEGENAGSLGLVGLAGFLGLVVMTLLPYGRRWPYGPLAALTLFAILLGTIGGFGSVFNLLITAQIRSYNRISVFIAFLCLFAALWAFDHFFLARRGPRASRVRYVGWAVIFLIGFLDQTPYAWFKSGIMKAMNRQAERFYADERFFAKIEGKMSPGARIFYLPYAPFPEHKAIERMPIYEPLRGYIHTSTLVWSSGAVKGREVDAWQCDVACRIMTEPFERLRRAVEVFADRIVCAGFDGLVIDTRGFATTKDGDRARVIEEMIHDRYEHLIAARTHQPRPKDKKARLQLPRVEHDDNRQFFLDLRPYRDELRQVLPSDYETRTGNERDWVALLWLGGFESPEELGSQDLLRFAPRDASAWFVNPSDRIRKFSITMYFGADAPGQFHMRLSGLIDDQFEIEGPLADASGSPPARQGVRKTYLVEVPPGRQAIRFQCIPPSDFVPTDHRKFCYYIMMFKREEVR